MADKPQVTVVVIPGVPTDTSVVDHPAAVAQRIARDGNRWRLVVELTWDVIPDDIAKKWEGDAEVDFANRATSRIRADLDAIVGPNKPFAHYHIIERTRRCRE